jgi:hypothetical protein
VSPDDTPGPAVELLEAVRHNLAATSLPLGLPGAERARQDIRNALSQLDDYILPRYRFAQVGGPSDPAKPGPQQGSNAQRFPALRPGRTPWTLPRAPRSCWSPSTRCRKGQPCSSRPPSTPSPMTFGGCQQQPPISLSWSQLRAATPGPAGCCWSRTRTRPVSDVPRRLVAAAGRDSEVLGGLRRSQGNIPRFGAEDRPIPAGGPAVPDRATRSGGGGELKRDWPAHRRCR